MSRLQKALFLSDKGYADLKKAIFACTLTNLAMLLPFCVTVMIFSEILTPFVSGGSIQWNHIWMLWGAGIVSAILVFLAAKMITAKPTLPRIRSRTQPGCGLRSIFGNSL